jgi:hypothetical protein
MRLCSIDGCDRRHDAKGFCRKHYYRYQEFGDPLAPGRRRPPEERFWASIAIDLGTGCWNWTGLSHKNGYGVIFANRRTTGAHRFSYELHVGPIPAGLTIDHLCVNPPCVNPAHLEPVTGSENVRRRHERAARTSCVNGHPFDESNTYIRTTGHRSCRACARETQRRYRTRQANR